MIGIYFWVSGIVFLFLSFIWTKNNISNALIKVVLSVLALIGIILAISTTTTIKIL